MERRRAHRGEASGCRSVGPAAGGSASDGRLASDAEHWDQHPGTLTLRLAAGRINHRSLPNQEAGYPFVERVQVTVPVDPAFPDAAARPLPAGFERCEAVAPALRSRAD